MDNDRIDRISRRAYELWEAAGRPHGQHDEHWTAAEQEFDAAAIETGTRHSDGSGLQKGMLGDGMGEENRDQPDRLEAGAMPEQAEEGFSDHPFDGTNAAAEAGRATQDASRRPM